MLYATLMALTNPMQAMGVNLQQELYTGSHTPTGGGLSGGTIYVLLGAARRRATGVGPGSGSSAITVHRQRP